MSNLLSLEALQAKADALAAEINTAEPGLTFIYAIHNNGQLQSSLQMVEDMIYDHPAGQVAMTLLRRKFPAIEPSAFQGLAAKQITPWLGLSTTTAMLAIVSINIDQYSNYYDALSDLYRQTWHGLEMADLCQDRAVLDKLGNRLMVPKRSALGEARSNLRSDIFTCLMLRTEGYQDIIDVLGKKRAVQALSKEERDKPEKFPFVTVVGATRFAAENVIQSLDADRPRLDKCKDTAQEIASITTDEQIRQWWRFCEPAQDMAWRGYRPDIILAASLYYGDDPYVHSITHQTEELSGIQAALPDQLEGIFNPFIDIHRNEQAHDTLIQESFNMALAQGVDTDSSYPLIVTAAKQNQNLLHGHFLGWCASALQGAARAFDQAAQQGRPVAQAAQLEFQMLKSGPPLESLYQLTREVINRHKNGDIVMLDQLPTLAATVPELDTLSISLIETQKFLRNEELSAQAHADDLDMVIMPTTPTLSRQLGVKGPPNVPAEFAFTAEAPVTAPDFIFGQGGHSSLRAKAPSSVDTLANISAPTTHQKIISLEESTGLSLEFDEELERKQEQKRGE